MNTIINNPTSQPQEEGFGTGMVLGIIIVILVLVVLFFVYAWPAMRGESNTPEPNGTQINVTIPGGQSNEPSSNSPQY